ncbi:RHS repeat-associated core domain-containing protein, partial [Streptoalloteichus tenebrarius]
MGDNPLVAQRKDSTTAITGIGIAESAADVYNGVQNKSWLEAGLGAAGTGLEALSLAMDPVGTLLQYAVSWLMEHVKPLSDALDWLAGDADQIAAYAQTWKNVARETGQVAQDFGAEVAKGTAGWTGAAADAYRASAGRQREQITAAATAADTIGTAVEVVGVLVGAVREIVRDLVAECVATLIARIPQWLVEIGGTFGAATPHVVASAASLIAKWVNRIKDFIQKLVRSLEKLRPLMKKLGDIWDAIRKALTKGGRGGPHTPKSPDAPTTRASTTPTSTKTPDTTTTSPTSTTPTASHPPDGGHTTSPTSTSPTSTSTSPTSTSPGSTSTTPSTHGQPDTPSTSTSPNGTPTTPAGGKPGGGGKNTSPNRPNDPNTTRTPVDKRTCVEDPIDVASGEMVLRQTDVELAGVLPLVLSRTHVSSYRSGRWFGRSWSSTVDQRLEVDDEGVVLVADEGVTLVYPSPTAGSPVLPETGARWPLSIVDGTYQVSVPELGQTLHFAGGDSGVLPLRAIVDRNGHRVDLDYDDDGVLSGLRHSGGYQITVDSTAGLVTALRLASGDQGNDLVLVRYVYDDARRLVEVINSSGQALRFDYDRAGRITGWQDRNGVWYRYIYDEHGRCVRTVGTDGYLDSELTYDTDSRTTVVTNGLGHRTTYHMNQLGQVVRVVNPLGHATVSEWDRYDRLLARTDPLGRTTRYRYSEDGDLVAVVRPDGTEATIAYNHLRLPVRVTEPDGSVWQRAYDDRGNLVAVTDPMGATTRYTHDERGCLSAVVDALGNTTRIQTNAAGLPVAVTDPMGATTRYTRDAFGRVTDITDPLGGVTDLGWTVEGRLAWRTLPDGSTERWHYDGEGNLVEHVDALGQVTRTTYTGFDLPASQTSPDGSCLSFAYDSELRLVSVTNPQGLEWRYEYDPAGNLVRETDFNGRTLTYTYDPAGQLTSRTNGAGQTIHYVRDALGNVVEQRSDDAVTTLAYDPAGRLVRAANAHAELTFQRDPLGRVLSETCDGRAVVSSYDALGRRLLRRTPSGAISRWEYGASDQPLALHTAGRTLRFHHDAAGREIQRALDTGPVLASTWDPAHRLISQTLTAPGQAQPGFAPQARVVHQRRYHYRPDGYLTGVDDQLTGPRRFDLDAAGRVTAVHAPGWTERYAYDPAGNLTHATWPTAPGAEAQGDRSYAGTLIQRAGNIHYQHDPQGRVLLRQHRTLSGKTLTWHYTWDAEDRLTAVTTPDGQRWRYLYDPLGRRIAKQRLAPDGVSVVEQVDFTWDGLVLAEQTHTLLQPTGPARHTTTWDFEPGTFRPLTQTERAPLRDAPQEWIDQRFYAIVTDLVGTPTELVDPAGNLAWHHRTTLWGAFLPGPRTPAYCPLRFPGQYHDPETGLHYNYFRYYDPAGGRYTTPDPLDLAGGPNPHTYVPNPTAWLDPLGLT